MIVGHRRFLFYFFKLGIYGKFVCGMEWSVEWASC